MVTLRVFRLLSLLALAVCQLSQQASAASQQPASIASEQASVASQQASVASQQASAFSRQGPAAEQLWNLLGQTMGETVLIALSRQYNGQQRQQQQQKERRQRQQSGATNITQPVCQRHPQPLPAQPNAYSKPEQLACARSCQQLRDQGGSPQDGVYWFTGMPVPVLCDFSHDGGGWTLLLTSVSKSWDLLSAKGRREGSPSLTTDYSILRYADEIRDLGADGRFAYRIEAQAQTNRRRWGGIWVAPRSYSFVDETGSQTGVRLVRRFDKWTYSDFGIERRMPWLRVEGGDTTVLTTSDKHGVHWWGTLASHGNEHSYFHSPWIRGPAIHSGTVLYWMRENEL